MITARILPGYSLSSTARTGASALTKSGCANTFRFRRYFDRDKPLSFAELRPVALLAQKYDIEEITSEARARLKITFSAQMDNEAYWERPAEYIRSGPPNPLWCEDRDLIGVVSLARTLRFPSVEVMALYHCCRLGADALFSGVRYDDMEVKLSQEDLRMCAHATDHLYQHNTYVMNALTDMFAYPAETPRIIPGRTSTDCKNALGLLIASGLQNEQFASPRALELRLPLLHEAFHALAVVLATE